MLNTDSIVNKRIKVFVYIPENNGSGFLNGSGFVVFAYTFLTTCINDIQSAKSADPDQMPHYAESHLGSHSLYN